MSRGADALLRARRLRGRPRGNAPRGCRARLRGCRDRRPSWHAPRRSQAGWTSSTWSRSRAQQPQGHREPAARARRRGACAWLGAAHRELGRSSQPERRHARSPRPRGNGRRLRRPRARVHNHDAEVEQGFLDRLPLGVFLELDASWAWYAGAEPSIWSVEGRSCTSRTCAGGASAPSARWATAGSTSRLRAGRGRRRRRVADRRAGQERRLLRSRTHDVRTGRCNACSRGGVKVGVMVRRHQPPVRQERGGVRLVRARRVRRSRSRAVDRPCEDERPRDCDGRGAHRRPVDRRDPRPSACRCALP